MNYFTTKNLIVHTFTPILLHHQIAMKRKIAFDFDGSVLKTFLYHAENVLQCERVDLVYKSTAKYNGALGASGHNGPIYGELTQHCMHIILQILVEKCELSASSRFLDVGSGIAKPNLHALQYPGVSLTVLFCF